MATEKMIKLKSASSNCQNCHGFGYCLAAGLNTGSQHIFDDLVKCNRLLKRGEHLVFAGDEFQSLFLIRSGSFKTYLTTSDGDQQITGFHLTGSILGVEGIERSHHTYTVEALETSSVCVLDFAQFRKVAQQLPDLHYQLLRMVSRAMVQEQEMMLVLGKMTAERRLATFLLDLSAKMKTLGFSPSRLHLSMTRYDIANYLGLAIETVSRLLSAFQDNGILKVERRDITIIEQTALEAIAQNFSTEVPSKAASNTKQKLHNISA